MNRERLLAAAACAVPGLLAGIHLTGLLFFLNPHLPFHPWPVIRTSAYYGVLGALTACALLLAVSWRRPERAPRLLPWSMAAVFGAASVLDLTHAVGYARFLPPGLHDRLIKAGLWLALASLITAYTAFLHTYRRRRPYGARSRFGIAGLAVLTVYSVFERREAFNPPPPATPRAAAIDSAPPPNLLILGLDGASLDAILPLSEQGLLPFFSETMRAGSYGRAESIEPAIRLSLWTTVVTGKYPFRHGVVAEQTSEAPSLPGERFHLTPGAIAFGIWGDRGAGDGGPAIQASAPALWQIAAGFSLDSVVLDFGVGLTDSSRARAAALGSAMVDERLARLGDGPPVGSVHGGASRSRDAKPTVDDARVAIPGGPAAGRLRADGRPGGRLPALLRLVRGRSVRRRPGAGSSGPRAVAVRLLRFPGRSGRRGPWEALPRPRMLGRGERLRIRTLRAHPHAFSAAGAKRRRSPAAAFQTPDGLLLLRGQGIKEDFLLTGAGNPGRGANAALRP